MKVRSWLKSHAFQSVLHMLSVDHSNIDGPPLAVKCVSKFESSLGGEVTCVCVRAHVRVCVCVCVCVYLHNMARADIVHVLYMPRADTLDARSWFWLQFRTRHH